MHLTAISSPAPTVVSCDVGSVGLNLTCRALSQPGAVAEWDTVNRSIPITETLGVIRAVARGRGIERLLLVAEPTGSYHVLLFKIAKSLGFETAFVDGGHVAKMRCVLFGDDGKTDLRDPHAIGAVAEQGRLIVDRNRSETFQLLRQWGKLYHDAESALIAAKSRIHHALVLLFPDFDFSTGFLYSDSGRAIFHCYRFNPHTIASHSPSRIHTRLRTRSNIRRSSVDRLLAQARATVDSTPSSRVTAVVERELTLAWEDLELAAARRQEARGVLESLYDEARSMDDHLPDVTGSPIAKSAFARFLGEAGPLSDYASWKQLLRMGGVNLRERKSGKYVGQTKIARTGRPLYRAIINQMALAVVRHDRLYGPYYHQKIKVQKMPGAKAMTAVARKIVKMLFGWYRSGAAFDATRVFTCEGQHQRAA